MALFFFCQTSKFIDEMGNLGQLESDAILKAKQLAAMRIDVTDIEAVKQHKGNTVNYCKNCLK